MAKKTADRIIRRIWDFKNQIGRFEYEEIENLVAVKSGKCTYVDQFELFKALREKCVDPELEDKMITAYEYFKAGDDFALYNETFNLHFDNLLDFAYANQYKDFYSFLIEDYNKIFRNIKNHVKSGKNFWTNDYQIICHFDRRKSDMAKASVEDYLDELIRRKKIYSYECVTDNENTLEFYITEDDIAF